MTLVITGATGEIGSRVVQHLLKRDLRPRVLARSEAKARLMFGEQVDLFVGDLSEPTSFRNALQGADALFLVNVGPEIPQRDKAAALLAKEMGVKKIVKLSSLDVEHGLAIGAWHEKGRLLYGCPASHSSLCGPRGSCQICLHGRTPSRRSKS
jgi:uncharacterized protein YbjT (DUF2867 family)